MAAPICTSTTRRTAATSKSRRWASAPSTTGWATVRPTRSSFSRAAAEDLAAGSPTRSRHDQMAGPDGPAICHYDAILSRRRRSEDDQEFPTLPRRHRLGPAIAALQSGDHVSPPRDPVDYICVIGAD